MESYAKTKIYEFRILIYSTVRATITLTTGQINYEVKATENSAWSGWLRHTKVRNIVKFCRFCYNDNGYERLSNGNKLTVFYKR